MLQLLQAAYDPTVSNGFYMGGSHMGYYVIILVVGVLGYIVQARLQSVFAKYAKEAIPNGMTGAEVAEKMLRENRIYNVKITHVGGHLTDHFNPQNMTVNLSDSVYSSRSISALAVACHECGHAIQHAQDYAPVKWRTKLVPAVNFASRFSWVAIMLGIIVTYASTLTIVGNYILAFGIGLFATTT
ncbi:MAG: zinc metallopeptidase, partial [Alistipes sp.]|nr:zinc metallopeptidase [Alistipes sp.]